MNQKNKFGIIVSTRSFFPSKLVKTARDAVMRVMDKLGYEYIMVGETDTQYGAVLTFDEAKTCAELFKAHREEICGIVVIMPNFCEELGIAEAIQLADLNVPVFRLVTMILTSWIWQIVEMHSAERFRYAIICIRETFRFH